MHIGRDGACTLVDDEINDIVNSRHGSLLQKASINSRGDLASASPLQIIKSLPRDLVSDINVLELEDYIFQVPCDSDCDTLTTDC